MILFFSTNHNTQEPPDFYIETKNKRLELKTFDIEAGANFDVANFEAFCSLLEKDATFIDSDYLIFAYSLTNGILKIKKVFLKKVWEICCGSSNYPVKTQIKRGMIYNIRRLYGCLTKHNIKHLQIVRILFLLCIIHF